MYDKLVGMITKQQNIIFKYEDGTVQTVTGQVGQTILEIARDNDIDIEGACGGVCACATCHVWVSDPWVGLLPTASDMEENMLDNGHQLQHNSRLCCQIVVEEKIDGIEVTVPNSSKNVSGHHH